MTSFLLLSFIPLQLKAESEKAIVSVTTNTVESTNVKSDESAILTETAIAEAQLARLGEIKMMDKSELTVSEKKELRNEVETIQRDEDRREHNDYDRPHHHNNTIYISFGGGLLIILLEFI